jgi:hypothetical protein
MAATPQFKRRPTATASASGDVVLFLSDAGEKTNTNPSLSTNATRSKKSSLYRVILHLLFVCMLSYTAYEVYDVIQAHRTSRSGHQEHRGDEESTSYDGTHQEGLKNYGGTSQEGIWFPPLLSARVSDKLFG